MQAKGCNSRGAGWSSGVNSKLKFNLSCWGSLNSSTCGAPRLCSEHLVVCHPQRFCGCAYTRLAHVICECGLRALTHEAVPSNQLQSQLVCQHRGVAMGDVGKGPSMDKHWCTLQQLEGHTNMQEELRKKETQTCSNSPNYVLIRNKRLFHTTLDMFKKTSRITIEVWSLWLALFVSKAQVKKYSTGMSAWLWAWRPSPADLDDSLKAGCTHTPPNKALQVQVSVSDKHLGQYKYFQLLTLQLWTKTQKGDSAKCNICDKHVRSVCTDRINHFLKLVFWPSGLTL